MSFSLKSLPFSLEMPSLKWPILPKSELSIASATTSSPMLSWTINKVNVCIREKAVNKNKRRKRFSRKEWNHLITNTLIKTFNLMLKMKESDIVYECHNQKGKTWYYIRISEKTDDKNHLDNLPWYWYDHNWDHLGCQVLPCYAFKTALHLIFIEGNSLWRG